MKKNLGAELALYPTPVVVAGTYVEGKPNWLLVAHVGIIGHDRIMISCAKQHYTNQGIKESGVVSINIVNQAMLPKADYVGSVSGSTNSKADVFEYEVSETGGLLIKESKLVMECVVDDIYETQGFDNFILKIKSTYAEDSILNENGKIDYMKLNPVLFDMTNYEYLKLGSVLGPCLSFKE